MDRFGSLSELLNKPRSSEELQRLERDDQVEARPVGDRGVKDRGPKVSRCFRWRSKAPWQQIRAVAAISLHDVEVFAAKFMRHVMKGPCFGPCHLLQPA